MRNKLGMEDVLGCLNYEPAAIVRLLEHYSAYMDKLAWCQEHGFDIDARYYMEAKLLEALGKFQVPQEEVIF